MNILFLATHLNSGGITSYLLTLTKGFIGRGHRVFLATSGGNREEEFSALGAFHFKMDIRTKSEIDPRIYLALPGLKKFIQKNKIDVIHAQTRITQVMARFLGQMTNTPHVSTCHGFFKKRFFRRMFPCWGDNVIAISSAVKDHLKQDFKVREGKIALIESGIDIEDFPLITREIRQETKARFCLQNYLTMGMIARLSDVKGQDILIKAMPRVIKEIPEVKLCLFGEGREEQSLKYLIKKLDLENYVLFFPNVHKTWGSLSLLDIFVMPSRQEGLGLSIMEAQAAGLTVVASRVGGIPGLIEDGRTGFLVDPENEEALAKKLVEVLKDPRRCQEIGLAAREFVKGNHSSEEMVKKTLSLYRKLVP